MCTCMNSKNPLKYQPTWRKFISQSTSTKAILSIIMPLLIVGSSHAEPWLLPSPSCNHEPAPEAFLRRYTLKPFLDTFDQENNFLPQLFMIMQHYGNRSFSPPLYRRTLMVVTSQPQGADTDCFTLN